MLGHGKLGATAAYGAVLLVALVCLSAIPSSAGGGPATCTLTLTGVHGQVSVDGVTHALPWSGSVTALHSVTLAALPDTGYHFTSWSGDLSGSASPVTITMDRNKAITAGFAPDRHTLSLSGANGAVTVNGVACTLPWSGGFDYGTSVALGAVPAAGYHFAGWSGDLSGTATPASLVITGDSSVEAGFAPNSYALSLSGEGGSVGVDGTDCALPWAGTFPYGTTVTLEARPDPGSHFTEWTGNLTGSANPTTLLIGGDRGVTASFALNTYPLSVSGSHGTVLIDGVSCSLPYTGTLTHGDLVTLEALPDTGYHFVGWSGDLSGSTSPTTLTVDGEKSIQADFSITAYTLELTGEHGAVAANGVSHRLPWSGEFDYGAEVTLEALPDTGYFLAYWSGNLSGSASPTAISMTGAKRISANFALRSCTLSVSGAHGTITVDGVTHSLPWADSYDYGTVVTLSATPATGYHFTGWEGDLTGSVSPVAITLAGDTGITAGFVTNTYTLTLTGDHGAVSVNAVSQSLPYSGVFSYRERVTLAAEPETGYRFTGWSGDLTKTTNPVTLTLDADKSIAVGFVANTYTLTLNGTHGEVSINGVAHALPWAGFYPYGTVVTLDVLPNTGYSFAGWSGDATGVAAPLDLTVDGAKSVVASFVANTYTLALSGANGTISVDGVSHPLPWSGTYSFDTAVILAASPDTGYHFAGWSGDLAGAATPSALTIDGDKAVAAEFVIDPYTLSLLGDHGTVSVNGVVHGLPWSGSFEYGTGLVLVAAPDTGYHFVSWSGDAGGSDPSVSITLEAEASVTAGFAPNRYTVSLSGEHGSVLVDGTSHSLPWSDSFDYGTSLTLAAAPDTGYHFIGWSGGLSGSDPAATLVVEGDTTVAAAFAINSYTLSLSGEHGSVTVDSASHALPWSSSFDHGTSVALEAVADSGYHFTVWSGDVTGVVSPVTLVMDGSKSAAAGFALNSYELTLSGTHGQVSVNGVSHALPWSGSFGHGTSITLAAVPDSGYHFAGWAGDMSGTDTPTDFTMAGARSISADFALNTYALSVAGTHGAVSVNGVSHSLPFTGTFSHGDSVTLAAVPDTGYRFTGWSGDLSGSTTPATFTMEGEKSITAGFAITRYALSLSGSHGAVSVNGESHSLPWSGTFDHGAVVALVPVAEAHYHFTSWSGDLTGSTSPASVTMERDQSIGLTFELDRVTLSLAGSHGAVLVDGASHALPWSGDFAYGASVTLTAVPDTDYGFTDWGGDLSGTTNPATIAMDASKQVTVSFALGQNSLTLTGSHGAVTASGVTHSLPWSGSFPRNAEVTLAAVPDTGHHFTDWSGDLTGSTSPATLTMSRDMSVAAGFALDTYTLSLTGSHGTVTANGVSHTLPWSGSFEYGTSITLAALPDTGYHFTAWSGDVTGGSSPATFALEGDRSVSVAFAINRYTLGLTGSNGQVTVDGASHALPWSGSFDHGVTVTLAATAEAGYTFTGWSGDLAGAANPASLLMDSDKSIGVSFPADPATWEGGALSLPGCLAWGEHATFSLTATNAGTTPWDEGFSLWSTDGAVSPLDRWGLLSLPLPGTVLPGDSYTFTGEITAPPLSTIDYAAPVGATQEGRTAALACDWRLQSGAGPVEGGPAQSNIVISRFPDIQPGTDGAWARFWTEQLAGAVPFVVKGYGDGSYRPRATVDRASIAVYVARATRLPLPDQADGTVFSDVPTDFWAAREIEACAAAGIVSGFRYQRYAPLSAVTRGQMAKLMAHGRQVVDPSFPIPHLTGTDEIPFSDVTLSNGYVDSIAACKDGDLVRGYSDGTYRPNETVTRDQLAAYVWRTFLRDWGTVIVLGGPAITAVNPASAGYVGYTSATTATGEQHYAYIVVDAVRLRGVAAPVEVTFGFTPVGSEVPTSSRTARLDQATLEAAAAAGTASGEPYLPISVSVPKLTLGSYSLSVTVGGYPVNQQQSFVYTVN